MKNLNLIQAFLLFKNQLNQLLIFKTLIFFLLLRYSTSTAQTPEESYWDPDKFSSNCSYNNPILHPTPSFHQQVHDAHELYATFFSMEGLAVTLP